MKKKRNREMSRQYYKTTKKGFKNWRQLSEEEKNKKREYSRN